MSTTTAAVLSGTATQLATFRIDGQLYGVRVDRVQEVLRGQRLTPVPLAPPAVAGMMNLRGQVVTAVDLRVPLGQPASAAPEKGVMVVITVGDEPISLLVDSISDVLDVSGVPCEPPPDTLEGPVRDLVVQTFVLESELMLELDAVRAVGA